MNNPVFLIGRHIQDMIKRSNDYVYNKTYDNVQQLYTIQIDITQAIEGILYESTSTS